MSAFAEYLNSVSPLPATVVSQLNAVTKSQELPKDYLLLRSGVISREIYLVISGLARTFYELDGRDVTQYFATEGTIIGGVDSFFSQEPSRIQIQTLEPSLVQSISYQDLERVYQQSHELERAGRLLAVQAFLGMQKRLYALQFHSATERYHNLLASAPDILQRAPLGHIASYLGMTQVTLSRIRAQ